MADAGPPHLSVGGAAEDAEMISNADEYPIIDENLESAETLEDADELGYDAELNYEDYEMNDETSFANPIAANPNLTHVSNPSAEDDQSSLYDWNSEDEAGNNDHAQAPNAVDLGTATSTTAVNPSVAVSDQFTTLLSHVSGSAVAGNNRTTHEEIEETESVYSGPVYWNSDQQEPFAAQDEVEETRAIYEEEEYATVDDGVATQSNAYMQDFFGQFPPSKVLDLVPTIIIKYYGAEYSFVPPIKGYPELQEYEEMQPLFDDIQVAHQPLYKVFQPLRDVFGDVGPQYELVLRFPDLKDLEIRENSELRSSDHNPHAIWAQNYAQFSMRTLVCIYNRMCYSDGESRMYPLIVEMSVRPSVGEVSALSQLFTAAENGIGLSSFEWSQDHQAPSPSKSVGVEVEQANTIGAGAYLEEFEATRLDAEHNTGPANEDDNLPSPAEQNDGVFVEHEQFLTEEQEVVKEPTTGELYEPFAGATSGVQGDEEGDFFYDDAHDADDADDEATAHEEEPADDNDDALNRASLNTSTTEIGVDNPVSPLNSETQSDLGFDGTTHENEQEAEEAVGNSETVVVPTDGAEGDHSENQFFGTPTDDQQLLEDTTWDSDHKRQLDEAWKEHCKKYPQDFINWDENDECTDPATEMGATASLADQETNAAVPFTPNGANVNHEEGSTFNSSLANINSPLEINNNIDHGEVSVANAFTTSENATANGSSATENALKRSHNAFEEDDNENHIEDEAERKRFRHTPETEFIDFGNLD